MTDLRFVDAAFLIAAALVAFSPTMIDRLEMLAAQRRRRVRLEALARRRRRLVTEHLLGWEQMDGGYVESRRRRDAATRSDAR